MAKARTLKTEIEDLVRDIAPMVEARDADALSARWASLFDDWVRRGLVKTTLKGNINKARSAIREAWPDHKAPEEQAFAISIVRHIPELLEAINNEYRAKLAQQHQNLVYVPRWLEMVQKANAMLKSDSAYELLAGLMLVTGRRQYELLSTGTFETIVTGIRTQPGAKFRGIDRWNVLFSGQAKTRNAPGTKHEDAFPIPVLAPAQLVVEALERLRESHLGRSWVGISNEELHERGGHSIFRNEIELRYTQLWPYGKKPHGVSFKPMYLRKIYAEIAWKMHPHPNLSKPAYLAKILGHRDDDIQTALAYFFFTIDAPDDQQGNQERIELQRQMLERGAERGEAWADPNFQASKLTGADFARIVLEASRNLNPQDYALPSIDDLPEDATEPADSDEDTDPDI